MVKHGAMVNPKQDTQREIVQFDFSEIKALVKEGEKIAFTREAEAPLVKFLEFCEQIDNLKKALKDRIYESANSVLPNNTGIGGERVDFKVTNKAYGAKYDFTPNASAEYIIVKKTVDSKLVDKYLKDNEELPEGITENQREKQLSLSLELKT